MAKVAGPVLRRLPAETAHRAAINGLKIAPPAQAPSSDPRLAVEVLGLEVPQSAWARRRLRQERRGSGRDAQARFRLRRGRHADAAAAGRQRPPAAVPLARRTPRSSTATASTMRASSGRGRGSTRRPPGLIGVNLGANKDAADRVEDYALGVRTFAGARRLSDHQRLLAQHAGIARPAAARGARRSDRAGGRGARRDRAAPPADAQDRARSRRPRARGHRRHGAHPSHRRPHRLEHHGRAASDA